jgi:hypothetical protein
VHATTPIVPVLTRGSAEASISPLRSTRSILGQNARGQAKRFLPRPFLLSARGSYRSVRHRRLTDACEANWVRRDVPIPVRVRDRNATDRASDNRDCDRGPRPSVRRGFLPTSDDRARCPPTRDRHRRAFASGSGGGFLSFQCGVARHDGDRSALVSPPDSG